MTRFITTRDKLISHIDKAILAGLAPDGGLYVPETFPKLDINLFHYETKLPSFACHLLTPFFSESKILFDEGFCEQVFNFPMPLHKLGANRYVLELFHGPTLSFKDFGARFFAQCLEQLSGSIKHTVLVATSGDTGSAVASALHQKKNVNAMILFPKDKISLRQQQQITCWGDNVQAIAVRGHFDDCQRMVKSAFNDIEWKNDLHLTTANSINIARLLPQILFYAKSSITLYLKYQNAVNYIVPSGNLGNVTACYWAKKLGFPIGSILIANNANDVLSDYLKSGNYLPKPSIATLANAMDVGNPSNLERLMDLYPSFDQFKRHIDAKSYTDKAIQEAIVACYQKYDYLICPHTATAYCRLQEIQSNKPWVICATAHPAKFETVLEPLLNCKIPVPSQLQRLLDRDSHYVTLDADLNALIALVS